MFVEFEEAFATVKHDYLMGVLEKFGVNWMDIRVIAGLYWKHKAVVRVRNKVSE